MGELISMFGDGELSLEQRAHLIQRCVDMTLEIALKQSELDRLKWRLENE